MTLRFPTLEVTLLSVPNLTSLGVILQATKHSSLSQTYNLQQSWSIKSVCRIWASKVFYWRSRRDDLEGIINFWIRPWNWSTSEFEDFRTKSLIQKPRNSSQFYKVRPLGICSTCRYERFEWSLALIGDRTREIQPLEVLLSRVLFCAIFGRIFSNFSAISPASFQRRGPPIVRFLGAPDSILGFVLTNSNPTERFDQGQGHYTTLWILKITRCTLSKSLLWLRWQNMVLMIL